LAAGPPPFVVFSKRGELRLIIDFLFCLGARRGRAAEAER
jgi:hypothetical protein